jgi:hypothetical protein
MQCARTGGSDGIVEADGRRQQHVAVARQELFSSEHDGLAESCSTRRRGKSVRLDNDCSDSPAAQEGATRRRGALHRRSGHCFSMCHSFSVLIVCLALWPMHKINNVDAYTLEEVRRADYNTNCGLGFAGLHCNEVITCEELDYCSGHGICQRGGYCICDTGWEGATCKQSYCPSGCSGHGSCAATGGCVCDAGFTGIICDQVICLGGGNCTGHGACLHGGVCSCEKGYLGAACDVIDVAEKCSNHGKSSLRREAPKAFGQKKPKEALFLLVCAMYLSAHNCTFPKVSTTTYLQCTHFDMHR